ncbi:hypothetical protein [Leptolyngbya sp. FACHB-261]|uniref:hypothetical protein n=1 Tax=Leptolyngbya sp. FACHB-261 TaxID=2692806 RepID=UPI0016868B90|nr:hypothetical protein [Leptolyngbya sp. FACHB-261]MBD2104828.1 hypothetical protein [Leptolyngbya sp. FACHB-261]
MENDREYEILLKLLEIDQNRISALDVTSFTIKGWAITLVSALIGFAIQQHDKRFLGIGIAAITFFAYFDFRYRKVQLSHVERSSSIQKHFKQYYLDQGSSLSGELENIFKSSPRKDFWTQYFFSVFLLYICIEITLILLMFVTI